MKEIILTKIHNYDLDNEIDEYIYLEGDKEITEKNMLQFIIVSI